jgi:hypothetical protein
VKYILTALVLATALPAHAQSREVRGLIEHDIQLNAQCRGGSRETDDDVKLADAACCARQLSAERLFRLGYCYGKADQIGADMKWHRCTRSSNRPEAARLLEECSK